MYLLHTYVWYICWMKDKGKIKVIIDTYDVYHKGVVEENCVKSKSNLCLDDYIIAVIWNKHLFWKN